ncbi:MAG TPA: universal stress protein [Bryobacteraceae bacterium]|nr:universal stress protein [Bryobacteraceae bacterium]
MFTHILLPTDGSALSEVAIRKGVQLARSIGARVSGVTVVPERKIYLYQTGVIVQSREETIREHKPGITRILETIDQAARAEGVSSETFFEVSDYPYEAIVKAAELRKCDLIVMASHGRRGISGVLLGSETQKVLTHSKVPVLVVR